MILIIIIYKKQSYLKGIGCETTWYVVISYLQWFPYVSTHIVPALICPLLLQPFCFLLCALKDVLFFQRQAWHTQNSEASGPYYMRGSGDETWWNFIPSLTPAQLFLLRSLIPGCSSAIKYLSSMPWDLSSKEMF